MSKTIEQLEEHELNASQQRQDEYNSNELYQKGYRDGFMEGSNEGRRWVIKFMETRSNVTFKVNHLGEPIEDEDLLGLLSDKQ